MIAAIVLILVCVLYRLVFPFSGGAADWLPNFAPMGALALCGAAFLPKRWAIALPMLAILASDLVLNAHYGVSLFYGGMLFRYAALGLICWMGWSLRGRRSAATLLPASAAGSFIFYFFSNTGAWLTLPQYAKTVAGWMQAQWLGVPGFPPAYLFLRNTLVSDLLFTGIFLACIAWTARPSVWAEPQRGLRSA